MKNKKVTIITGDKHSGKTNRLLHLIEEQQNSGFSIGGLVAIGNFKNGIRHSFYLKDINTNTKKQLMSREYCGNCEKIGSFYIDNKVYKWGVSIIEKLLVSSIDTIVIDEIGILELEERGWYSVFKKLLKTKKNIVITVRDKFVDRVVGKFGIENNYFLINVDK